MSGRIPLRWWYAALVSAIYLLYLSGTALIPEWYARPLFGRVYLTPSTLGFLLMALLPLGLMWHYLRYRKRHG